MKDSYSKGMWHAKSGYVSISDLSNEHLVNILCNIENGRYPTPHRKFLRLEDEAERRGLSWRAYMPTGISSVPEAEISPASESRIESDRAEYALEGLRGLEPGLHHILIKHVYLDRGVTRIYYQKMFKSSDRHEARAVASSLLRTGAKRGRRSYD